MALVVSSLPCRQLEFAPPRRYAGNRAFGYTLQNWSGIIGPAFWHIRAPRGFIPIHHDSHDSGVHMSFTEQQIKAALAATVDPNTGKDFVAGKALKNLKIDGADVSFDIELGYPAKSQIDAIRKQVIAAVRTVPGVGNVSANVFTKIVAHAVQMGVKLLPGVKNIIAVASGKGGVGKSTTAVNLALALVQEGARVGILDADIYGPSQPQMLGLAGRQPESRDGKSIEPLEAYGLQAMSIGFMVDVETPMVWRGPMVAQALDQLLGETNWSDLDYLIVDMPPGTGDIQLSLSQKVPVTGAVIVTTPQDIALIDARKGLKMFEKVNIPILGIVENMSIHICSKCGHEEHIFGTGGGKPTVVGDPDSRTAEIYRGIARRVAVKIGEKAKDMTSKFPNIVVQNT